MIACLIHLLKSALRGRWCLSHRRHRQEETTRDIDELLTVHEDVLWNEYPVSEVKRIQRWGQNSAANLYINDVVFIRPNVRQDL